MEIKRSHPISTEARARLRVWEAKATARFKRATTSIRSPSIRQAASDFVAKRGTGRHRAFTVLRRAFDQTGTLEVAHLEGPRPVAMWSVIGAPVEDMMVQAPGGRPLTDDEEQRAVPMHYFAAGRFDGGAVFIKGVWACSYSIHSLGRFFMRTADPDALDQALTDSHRWLLQAPARSLHRLLSTSVLLPAADGFFWGDAESVRGRETQTDVLHCRCRTFLSEQMAKDAQIAESAAILKRERDDTALAAGLLHPLVLRAAAPATAA